MWHVHFEKRRWNKTVENERACSYLQYSVQPVSIFHLEFSLSQNVECDFDKCVILERETFFNRNMKHIIVASWTEFSFE